MSLSFDLNGKNCFAFRYCWEMIDKIDKTKGKGNLYVVRNELWFAGCWRLSVWSQLAKFLERKRAFVYSIPGFISCNIFSLHSVSGRVGSLGSKAFSAPLLGRISIWGLAAVQVMPWEWTWFPKGFRMSLISFKTIFLTWMLLVYLVSYFQFSISCLVDKQFVVHLLVHFALFNRLKWFLLVIYVCHLFLAEDCYILLSVLDGTYLF